jgi:hypothetical protein
MEKLRVVLEQLKKYHFWILCGLIVVISFVTWFLATGERANYFKTRKAALDSTINLVTTISNKGDHPSESSIKGIIDKTNGPLLTQVDGAANRLYNEQRENNRLPIVFTNDPTAQQGFEANFNKIWGPMQLIEKMPPDSLGELYRSRYRNHIDEHFPELFKLIERRTEVEDSPSSLLDRSGGRPLRGGLGPNAAKPMVGIVDWDDADKKIKAFKDRFSGSTPSTLDIMMTQEELWVYETLLKVIRNTNNIGPDRSQYPKPANEKEARDSANSIQAWLEKNYQKPRSHKDARIKQILAMDIGRDAVQAWKNCESPLINLGDSSGDAAGQAAGAKAAVAAASPGDSPLSGRYVDEKGKPLADASQQPFPEFRMMPINLKVVIEQKDIPRLLAECANSAMRIDVRGVRILVQDPGPVDVSGGDTATVAATPPPEATPRPTTMDPMARGDRSRGRPGFSRGPVIGSGGGMTSSNNNAPGSEFVYDEESADPVHPPVPVEVQGIIYIYNPTTPKENPSDATKAATSATTPPAAPAAVPATVPASSAAAPRATVAPAAGTVPAANTANPATPSTLPATTPLPGGQR